MFSTQKNPCSPGVSSGSVVVSTAWLAASGTPAMALSPGREGRVNRDASCPNESIEGEQQKMREGKADALLAVRRAGCLSRKKKPQTQLRISAHLGIVVTNIACASTPRRSRLSIPRAHRKCTTKITIVKITDVVETTEFAN